MQLTCLPRVLKRCAALLLEFNAKCERKEIIFSGLYINLLILQYWTVIFIVMPKKSEMKFSLNKRKHKQTNKKKPHNIETNQVNQLRGKKKS